MKDEQICGYCCHHCRDNEEWVCTNPESECLGEYTEYNDGCTEFEARVTAEISKKKNS